MTKKSKEYEWVVSSCGPRDFPSEIYRGSFHYGKNSGEPVIGGKTLTQGWGSTSTVYGGRFEKEAPLRLDIVYLSYRENKFYGGSFELPKEKIERLFEEGFYNLYDKTKNEKRITYKEIVVGVGPGGYVAVWLIGRGFKTQVAGFYCEETDVDFADFNPDGLKDRDLYVSHRLERIDPESMAKPIPFGLWETLATEYQWKPVVKGAIVDHVFFVDNMYYNGNGEIYVHNESDNIPLRTRTIPKQININWFREPDGYRVESEFEFDEEEMFAVFKELVTDPEKQQAELIFNYKAKKDIDVFVKVGNQQKQLEKVKLGTFKSIH